jgi:hypothetical protein
MKLGRKIWEIISPTTTLARTPGREGESDLVCRIIKVFDSGHNSGIEMVSHGGLFGRLLWLGPRERWTFLRLAFVFLRSEAQRLAREWLAEHFQKWMVKQYTAVY